MINECSLRISWGDKLLLEGPSGGGKSTLASLLVGLRQPDSGLLLLRGFDRGTFGDEGWRRLVVSAPQFHENHVMTGTFAFNLLMGRRWPAWAADLEECEAVWRELGLGELIDRMPAGLMKMSARQDGNFRMASGVGFTSPARSSSTPIWSFSTRALRRSTRRICDALLTCVLDRASTLVVIAHP